MMTQQFVKGQRSEIGPVATQRKKLDCCRTGNDQAASGQTYYRYLFVYRASQRGTLAFVVVDNSVHIDCLMSNYWRTPVADS